MLVCPRLIVSGQRCHNMAFQLAGAAHHVFTGDDIKRGGVAVGSAHHQAFSDGGGDTLQHHRADCRRDQIDLSNQGDDFVADAADRVYAGYRVDLLVFAHHMHLVAVTRV